MFEKFIDILKAFFDKYFIQALISIIPTVIIYYYTPDNIDFTKKVGKELYILLIFVICFLLLECTIYITKSIRSKIHYNNFKKRQDEKIEEETIKYLWNYVDSLNGDDKNLLKFCLENNNKIINVNGCLIENRLLNQWFNKTQITSDGTLKAYDFFNARESDFIEKGYIVTQYKLKNEVYEVLMYSKNKYGKISNFE